MNEPTSRVLGKLVLASCVIVVVFIFLVAGMLSIAKGGSMFTVSDIYTMALIVYGALVLLGLGLYFADEFSDEPKGGW